MNWDDMTEAQRDEANDAAYAAACDRLRTTLDRNPQADMVAVRQHAIAELAADMKASSADVKRGNAKRATRLDKRCADYAKRTLATLALVEGFIWDAEI